MQLQCVAVMFCCYVVTALSVSDEVFIFKEVLTLAKGVVNSDCRCDAVKMDTGRQRRIVDLISVMENMVDAESVGSRSNDSAALPHYNQTGRVKRFSTRHRKVAIPPGTLLTMTPSVFLPFVRNLPPGLLSSLTFSIPFSINFDQMGYTDESSNFGVFPIVTKVMDMMFGKRRTRRATDYSGGHRMLVYHALENTLYNFGLNGRDCLLRAICEIHESPLHGHGLLGEMLQFVFTASSSPDLGGEEMDYVQAERTGRDRGDCKMYYAKCPHSIFNDVDNNLQ